ncbi:MAG: 6-phosphogluconolactonase, partial [Candidatus Xenobia bacterium]
MNIEVVEDYAALSRRAADLIVQTLREKQAASMVLATGSTPMGAYRELSQRQPDASLLRVFQLNAFVGIQDDKRSAYGALKQAVLDPLRVATANVVRLRGDADDPEGACAEYTAAVHDSGGYDLALLGLGPNGHIGFNEPPSSPQDGTRRIVLSPAS